jgi:hypothetical protein
MMQRNFNTEILTPQTLNNIELEKGKTRCIKRRDVFKMDLIRRFFTYKKLARDKSHRLIIVGAISFLGRLNRKTPFP